MHEETNMKYNTGMRGWKFFAMSQTPKQSKKMSSSHTSDTDYSSIWHQALCKLKSVINYGSICHKAKFGNK